MRPEITRHFYRGEFAKTYDLPLKEWWYYKDFILPETFRNKRIILKFAGIDYASKIWINGEFLGKHEGQFTPFEFDVTNKVKTGKKNSLSVLIEPAPRNIIQKLFQLPRGQWNRQYAMDEVSSTLKCWKSRTMTGWDWGTPLWTMGIWQDVTLLGTNDLYLDKLLIFPDVKYPYNKAKINIQFNANTPKEREVVFEYRATCITSDTPVSKSNFPVMLAKGNTQIAYSFEIDSPALWWPNGYGDQNLYGLTVTVKDKKSGLLLDEITDNFGIREVKVKANPDADDYKKMKWYSPDGSGVRDVPKNPKANYLTEINGLPVFLHGGNWLPPDLLYGRPGYEEYEHLIRMAVLANYNVFRIWGGGLIEKQAFYDLCDQYGILVWQEMPHAGARPLETTNILYSTAEEQRMVMNGLINHPCIFRYGFGNELYIDKNNSAQVTQFERICKDMDPARSVNGPDPVCEFQRHGPHWFYIPGEYNVYNSGTPLTVGPDNPAEWTEYGASGASSIETLKRIIPNMKLNAVPYNDSIWGWHNAMGAYTPSDWLKPEIYKSLFGELSDIETEIKVSQFVQAEGLRYANQSHRRAKWHRSGCYMWTFNEPWPNVAHGCIVEYYGSAKPALYYTRNSYSQIDISTKYNSIVLQPEDTLFLPVFVTSTKKDLIDECILKTTIVDLNGKIYYKDSKEVTVSPLSSHRIDSLNFIIPAEMYNNVLLVRFDLFDRTRQTLSSETYTFGIKDSSESNPCKEYLRPMLGAPATNLSLKMHYEKNISWGRKNMALFKAHVKNTSIVPALFVQLKSTYSPDEIYFKENYFILLAGEEKRISVLVSPELKRKIDFKNISVDAWNFNPLKKVNNEI